MEYVVLVFVVVGVLYLFAGEMWGETKLKDLFRKWFNHPDDKR